MIKRVVYLLPFLFLFPLLAQGPLPWIWATTDGKTSGWKSVDILPHPICVVNLPYLVTTKITDATTDRFPIPKDKELIMVIKGTVQVVEQDYTVVSKMVFFTVPPQVGEIVQLLVF